MAALLASQRNVAIAVTALIVLTNANIPYNCQIFVFHFLPISSAFNILIIRNPM